MRKDCVFIFWLVVAVAVMPTAAAQEQTQQRFLVTGGLGQQSDVLAYHQFPAQPSIPNDHEFSVSATLFSDDNDFDVDVVLFELHGGCIEDHRHLNVTNTQSVALTVTIDMADAETCSWHFIGEVSDQQGTAVHRFHLNGNAVAYNMVDIGQDSHASLSQYGAWSLAFMGLLGFALFYGRGMVWLMPAGAATIGFLGVQYDTFPVGPQWALFVYIIALWAIWWVSRRKERSVQT